MKSIRMTACAVALLAVPTLASAFEGTMKLRTVAVEREKLAKITGDKVPTAEETLALDTNKLLDNKAAVLALEGRDDEAEQTWQEALALCDTLTAPQFARLREAARDDILQKIERHRVSRVENAAPEA